MAFILLSYSSNHNNDNSNNDNNVCNGEGEGCTRRLKVDRFTGSFDCLSFRAVRL